MKYIPSVLVMTLLLSTRLHAIPFAIGELSLSDALKKADEQNFDIRLMETEVQISRADLNRTYSLFLPQITLSETYVATNDPLNVFGIKLKQELVTASDFNPLLLNDPKTIKNFTTKVEIQQPLLNLDGFFGRGAAAAGHKATEEKRKRTIEYIHFEVKKTYYQLVLAKASLKVIDQSVTAIKAFRDQAKNYYDQGMIHRSDLLMAEVQLLDVESKKIEAANQLNDASERLHFLMGVRESSEIIPSDTLQLSASESTYSNIPVASDNRSDMRAMRYGISAMEKMHSTNLFKLAPTLNAFGSYELNEKNLFGTKGKNWMAGIMLKWEIFKGWDNIGSIQKSAAQLRNAKINYDKARQNNFIEMDAALRNLTVMRKKTEISNQSVQQAEESMRIIADRYAKGMEKTSDLLMAEATYSKARLNYLQALFGYNINLFLLDLLFEQKTEPI